MPVPEGLVEVRLDTRHLAFDLSKVTRFSHGLSHLELTFEGEVIPAVVEDGHVLVVAPVTPGPATFTRHDQAVFAELPDGEVVLTVG